MQTIQVGNKIFNLERKSTADREELDYKILQTIPLGMKGVISVQDSMNLQKELEKYKEEGILILSTVDALLICFIDNFVKSNSIEELIERLR